MLARARNQNSARSGLTLLEVTVLILILAVILALLRPIILSTGNRVHKVQCKGYLRTIGVGLQQYVHYSDDYFPCYRGHPTPWNRDLYFTWRDVVTPFITTIKMYTVDGPRKYDRILDRGNGVLAPFTDPGPDSGTGRYFGSRMVFRGRPSLLDGTMVEGHLHESQIADPGNTASIGPASKQFLNDDGGPDFKYNTFYYSVGLTYTGAIVPGNRQHVENIDFRHKGRANVLFLDLHIEFYDEDDPADRARLAAVWNTIALQERDEGESDEEQVSKNRGK